MYTDNFSQYDLQIAYINTCNPYYFIIKGISHSIFLTFLSRILSFSIFPLFLLGGWLHPSEIPSIHFYFAEKPDWIIRLTNYFNNLHEPSCLQAQLLQRTISTKKAIKSIQSPTWRIVTLLTHHRKYVFYVIGNNILQSQGRTFLSCPPLFTYLWP